MNTPNLPDDKITNDTILCMMSPAYAVALCGKLVPCEIEPSPTKSVLMAVLDWYGKNYRHAGDWFTEDMRTPTSSEITKDMNAATKAHAETLIAFKDSPKCIERLMINARTITFA